MGAGIRDMTVGLFVLIGLQAFSFVIAGLHPPYNANVVPSFQEFFKIFASRSEMTPYRCAG